MRSQGVLNRLLLAGFPSPHLVASCGLKLARVGVLTPWKLVNYADQALPPEAVVKHLLAYPWKRLKVPPKSV